MCVCVCVCVCVYACLHVCVLDVHILSRLVNKVMIRKSITAIAAFAPAPIAGIWSSNSSQIFDCPGDNPFNSQHVFLLNAPVIAVLNCATDDLKNSIFVVITHTHRHTRPKKKKKLFSFSSFLHVP